MKPGSIAIALSILTVLAGLMYTGCVEEQQPTQNTIEQQAVDIVTLLKEKNYTTVYRSFNHSISTQITAEQFQSIWEQQVTTPYGNITEIKSTRTVNESGYQTVYVTCGFSKQDTMDVKLIFDDQESIISLTIVPTTQPYTPPSYVNQTTFTETAILVQSGEWLLPGNLTIPTGTGPFPAVVLVHGSGPNDQDETIGPNKPFKDLAWGLASQGIVVLRYEKRTKQYPEKVNMMLQNFTVHDETIDDAIAAIDGLMTIPAVNQSHIYLLGHSLGGMLAPQIASQDHRIAGLIILAGNTRPLEDLILENKHGISQISAEQINHNK